jgi:ketosteroid isomerase-like protein
MLDNRRRVVRHGARVLDPPCNHSEADMKPAILTATLATVLLLGCQSQIPSFTDEERASVEAEIKDVRDAYFDAATTFDADAMVAYWDDDFIHVSNAYVQPLTLEGLREAWKPLSHMEMDISSDRVVALSRDAGYTIFTASYVVYDAAGTALGGSDWAGTHIWRRTDEGWKVQAVHEGRPGL